MNLNPMQAIDVPRAHAVRCLAQPGDRLGTVIARHKTAHDAACHLTHRKLLRANDPDGLTFWATRAWAHECWARDLIALVHDLSAVCE